MLLRHYLLPPSGVLLAGVLSVTECPENRPADNPPAAVPSAAKAVHPLPSATAAAPKQSGTLAPQRAALPVTPKPATP
jgi:hypothetical protein